MCETFREFSLCFHSTWRTDIFGRTLRGRVPEVLPTLLSEGFQSPDDLGVLGGEIGCFAEVRFEIEQGDLDFAVGQFARLATMPGRIGMDI